MMETTQIIALVTVIITWIMGILAKKNKFIDNNLIPVQNIAIGIVIAIIEFVITKDFNVSIAISGLLAGGSYDLVHNLNKILNKGDDTNE